MQENENEGGSFADQIEAELLSDVIGGAIDLPEDEQGNKGIPLSDWLAADRDDLPPGDRQILDDLQAEVDADPAPEGVPMAEQLEMQMRDLDTIKLIPGYQLFKDAIRGVYANMIEVLAEKLHGIEIDDNDIAMMFKQQLEAKATRNHIDATREWADQQGAIRPVTGWVPLNDSGYDFVKSESGTLDDPLGQLDVPVAPASSDTDIPDDLTEGELMVLQTEKTIRELQADVERLEQESIRNSDAVLHWSEVSDMFNTFMAEDGVEATSDPLTVRIAAYVSDLRERSFRLAGLEK